MQCIYRMMEQHHAPFDHSSIIILLYDYHGRYVEGVPLSLYTVYELEREGCMECSIPYTMVYDIRYMVYGIRYAGALPIYPLDDA
jgi:hypothetical protein